jgi:AmmeMemoRadiSam system protein B
MKRIIDVFLLVLLFCSFVLPQSIRPIRDNVGYTWQADKMDLFVKWLDDNTEQQNFNSDNLIAGISPHDDYLYAGKIYYPLFKLIHAKEVVIFGVTHGTVRKEINDTNNVLILDEFDKWKGPYKDVEISPLREIIKAKLKPEYFWVSNKTQTLEHSIEALLPFLQYYNKDIKITPIMVTKISFDRMDSLSSGLSDIISGYIKSNNYVLGKDIFFLMSNDANHYGEDFDNEPYGLDEQAHKTATENDKRIADENLNGTITREKIKNLSDELWPEAGVNQSAVADCPLWCGRYPVVFGLMTINKIANKVTGKKITGKVFKYGDTFTGGVLPVKGTMMGTTAPFSLKHWVGFFSAGIYK